MDNRFIQGLQQLKKADPNRVIEILFRLFESIGTMKVHEVTAAKQTLDLFRSASNLDAASQKIVEAMDRALVVRASVIYDCSMGSRTSAKEHDAARISFNSAFGTKCCKEYVFRGYVANDH
jgi:flagellar biosynthesis regulator FlaF